MRYLIFDLTEATDGISTLEAMATTTTFQAHEEAKAEAEQVVAWAHQTFPNRHGPVEEGYAWDHELLIQHEVGEWITVTLTLSASPEFVETFQATFIDPTDEASMIDADTRTRLLSQYPVLAETSRDTLDVLMASATFMQVPAGAMMFDENQPCMGFALLLAGSARVVKAAPNGRELHLYDVTPGEACILTSSCLLGKSTYQARCTVLQPAELVVLPPASFRLLFSASEAFREHVFSRYSERISDLLQLVSAVAFQKLDQRMAHWLVQRESPVRVTHQALADDLGSLREIVSRVLKNFADQGWVALGREQIEVLDAPALLRLSDA